MKTAWILPGGASMGAIQVGQSEALLAAGVAPDLVIGTSAGALNAAWLAADPTERGVATLARLWLDVRRRDIFPLRPGTTLLGLLGRRDHLVAADGLTRWLETHLPYRHLEEARLPLTVTATDFHTGEAVYLSSGPAIPALVASCAIPGIFPPVSHAGRLLIDGGLSVSTPIDRAVAGGAERVYVLPTLHSGVTPRPGRAVDVALRSLNLLLGNVRRRALLPWSDQVEIWTLPAPPAGGASPLTFGHGRRLMDDARDLTRQWLATARPVGGSGAGAVRAG